MAKGDDVAEQIMEFTHGDGGDLYWENANMLDQTLTLTVQTMALGARFIQTAHTKSRHPVPLDGFRAKGGQIIASEGHIEPGTLGKCLRVMAAGVDVRPAITKRYEFDDLVEAFRFGYHLSRRTRGDPNAGLVTVALLVHDGRRACEGAGGRPIEKIRIAGFRRTMT